MLIFDLEFTDGKACRYLCPDPEATVESERASLEAMFCGRLASMVRIITPPPAKLPWKRQHKTLWTLGLFALSRLDTGEFHCFWPGGEVTGDKDAISAAVRRNWSLGV
jgi:hypothetical protein